MWKGAARVSVKTSLETVVVSGFVVVSELGVVSLLSTELCVSL